MDEQLTRWRRWRDRISYTLFLLSITTLVYAGMTLAYRMGKASCGS